MHKHYTLKNGTLLDGRYLIGDVIGEGGFGITYSAETQRLGMRVAIKEYFCRDYMLRDTGASDEMVIPDPADADRFSKEKERFLKEARILRDFANEQGVVRVVDYFESNNAAYIVMDYVDGETLREHVRKNGRMSPDFIFPKIKQILKTLDKVHKSGLVHRDISPDNIMIAPDGSLCLIDFGAAYRFDNRTQSYTIVGKNGYTAPEQYGSDGTVGPAADIYSLSATLSYCLTAVDPEDSLQRLYMQSPAKTPSSMGVKVPDGVDKILAKGMAIKAGDRYADAMELYEAVDKLFPEASKEEQGSSEKKYVLAGLLIGLLAAGAAAFIWLHLHRVELKFRNIDTRTVWLTADKDVNLGDYLKMVSTVKGRLETFAGKDNYLWEEKDGEIRMEFPESILFGNDPEDVTKSYLSRPMRIFMADPELENFQGSPRSVIFKNSVEIPRDGMESVNVTEGGLPGVDREEFELPPEGDCRYLRIELTEDLADRINGAFGDILKEDGKTVALFYDINESALGSFFGERALTCGDGRSLDMIPTDQEGSYIDTLVHDLTTEASPGVLGVTTDEKISWEDVGAAMLPGAYQCSVEELGDSPVVLKYDMRGMLTGDQPHVWSVLSDLTLFKYRLDALQVPYAVGMGGNNVFRDIMRSEDPAAFDMSIAEGGKMQVYIGLRDEDIENYMISTLSERLYYKLESRKGYRSEAGDLRLDILGLSENENGITIPVRYFDDPKKLTDCYRKWEEEGDDRVYLAVGDHVFAGAAIADLYDTADAGEVTFTDLCVTDMEGDESSKAKLLDYLKRLGADNMKMSYPLKEILKLSKGQKPVHVSSGAYPGKPDAEAVQKAAEIREKLGDTEASVKVSGPFRVSFFFTVTGNADHMEKSLELVERIYDECSLGDERMFYSFYFDYVENGTYRTIVSIDNTGKEIVTEMDIYGPDPDHENDELLNDFKRQAEDHVKKSEFFNMSPDDIYVGYIAL